MFAWTTKVPILGYNLTHTTLFDYDRIDLRDKSLTEVKKLVSILHYSYMYIYVYLLQTVYN